MTRRVYLIDRQMQLKYVWYAIGFSVLISVASGTMAWWVRIHVDQLASEGSGTGFLSLAILAHFGVVFSALAAGTLMLTNRMAGPIFVVRRYLKEIRAGRTPALRPLRKADEFQEFYQELAETINDFRRREVAHLTAMEDAVQSGSITPVEKYLAEQRKNTVAPPTSPS